MQILTLNLKEFTGRYQTSSWRLVYVATQKVCFSPALKYPLGQKPTIVTVCNSCIIIMWYMRTQKSHS